ncbi:MAG: DUF3014 domain-containing protein [Candidatus Accumulibacter sp.]|jgi:hypothetical protein|nr:DUF3014 domain-containing protein [Accumulibacter sp.]
MRTGNEIRKKKDRRTAGLIVIVLLAAGVAGYFLFAGDEATVLETTAISESVPPPVAPLAPVPAPVPEVVMPEPPEPSESPEPPILHPIEPEVPDEPLPELGGSDKPVEKALGEIMGKKGVSLMIPEELIYHIVVTVDNLPRKHLPASIVPLKRAEDVFVVEGRDETLAIGAQNARRYGAYAAAIKATDSAKLVEFYRRFYPLFQSVYRELGYAKANFNDRLVTAIDDLIAAPDPTPPIRLAQPRVLFEYADPDLESRSAGQKIMMRIGQENAAAVKAKLREIRAQIVR